MHSPTYAACSGLMKVSGIAHAMSTPKNAKNGKKVRTTLSPFIKTDLPFLQVKLKSVLESDREEGGTFA